jgi:phosphoserine phosphatase
MAIATLIAAGRLDDRLVERALDRLHAVDPGSRLTSWIDEGDAADLAFDGDHSLARTALESLSGVDVVVQDDAPRFRRLLVADMDSTMIGQECIDELADYAGIKPQISAITERAMRGELEFESALRERVALLADLDEQAIAACLAERIRPMPGARALVATLRHRGCRTVLVTGGFHHFADPVAAEIGFDRVVSNRLAVAGGRLDGTLEGAIMDAGGKERVLREELARLGDGAVSLATGDGANDVPLLRAATWGLAYRGKHTARAAADGWIDRGDLTSVLKLFEIPESEWVAG